CGASDDFEGLKKEWEEFYYAFGHPREGRSEADTMIPRVSSKLSMLVSHTIFSTFGKIRNENDGLFSAVFMNFIVAEDADEYSGDLVSGLYCKIVVQFEKYNDFVNAMKAFCGRSMKKHIRRYSAKSRLLTNMEQGWVLLELEENIGSHDGYRNEAVGYNTDDVRRKTFRVCMIHDHIL
ncbi:hypothetical protein HID58_060099, partial [Brassica napus]